MWGPEFTQGVVVPLNLLKPQGGQSAGNGVRHKNAVKPKPGSGASILVSEERGFSGGWHRSCAARAPGGSGAGVGGCIGSKMESEEGRKRIQSHLYCLDSRERPEACFGAFTMFQGLGTRLSTAGDVPRAAQMFRALLKHLQSPCAAAAILCLPLAPPKCEGTASGAADSSV